MNESRLSDGASQPLRLPGLTMAAVASIGAGLIHAGAIGVNASHLGLARLIAAAAAFQLAFGVAAFVRPRRLVAAIGAAGNLAIVGTWLFTRLEGVSFINGLHTRQPAKFADAACALLGLASAGLALAAVLIGWRREPAQRVALASVAIAALAIPAVLTGSIHVAAAPKLVDQTPATVATATAVANATGAAT
ncbi:MAG TPA: hypothetical protein VGM78_02485, partial [Ilumatobacteraceae bacterium]